MNVFKLTKNPSKDTVLKHLKCLELPFVLYNLQLATLDKAQNTVNSLMFARDLFGEIHDHL